MKVCVFRYQHPRSKRIADALAEGARRVGWAVLETDEPHSVPRADVFMSYGWCNKPIFDAYRAAGLHYVYVDLGYWQRKKAKSDYGGFHKVVVDDRHATSYFRRLPRPASRLAEAPSIEPWQSPGKHIVLAGMSAKSAPHSGFMPLAWERSVIRELKAVTDRPIVYRPKPSWRTAQPIQGTQFSPGEQPIDEILKDAHALVTLHSNAALDALAAGVPVHSAEGLASVLSTPLSEIERPSRPADRQQFFADVSYCQWKKDEIASGMVFDLFRSEGLLA